MCAYSYIYARLFRDFLYDYFLFIQSRRTTFDFVSYICNANNDTRRIEVLERFYILGSLRKCLENILHANLIAEKGANSKSEGSKIARIEKNFFSVSPLTISKVIYDYENFIPYFRSKHFITSVQDIYYSNFLLIQKAFEKFISEILQKSL